MLITVNKYNNKPALVNLLLHQVYKKNPLNTLRRLKRFAQQTWRRWEMEFSQILTMYEEREMRSSNSQYSSKNIVNGGLCVIDGFVKGGVVVCSVKECVINFINEELDEPVFNWIGAFLNWTVMVSSLIFNSLSSQN